jgi:hypothetical protein
MALLSREVYFAGLRLKPFTRSINKKLPNKGAVFDVILVRVRGL